MSEEMRIGNLTPIDIEEDLKKSFMSYAMAVIVSRALPDVRDGLKPVHRRILYSMMELGVTPDKPYRKSARIVGDCMGKYHPHGDRSVYDAMVRLAQDFSTRNPLVEGQGNFGSVDGDSPAAMRYTEARLSKISMEMIRDLEKETVDFYPNFDETLMQPAVLPSRFPNLLVNGSQGIAVGMATNIPPHNLGEVIDGVVHMIDHPDCSIDDLMAHIQGPDFPTGGVILGRRGIYDAYHEGRGRVIVRAKSEIEEMAGNRQRIVVTEIPYMVNKAKLIEKIAELVHEKRVEGISDIRDESDRQGMRIVIELKRDVNANVVLNYLYKHTQLQDTFGVIMIALVDGEPKVLSLRQVLRHYLDHQEDVVRRRTQYDLNKAEARCHILEGLLIALDNIDEVIRIIRSSRATQDAKDALMEKFGLSERQAQAILDMRLARLTGLEREKIEQEHAELQKLIAYYREVLQNERMLLEIIKTEILEIKEKYADPRRTEISSLEGEIDMLDLIQEEDMVITLTHYGYVKRLPKATYRAQKRGGKGVVGATTREEDFVEQIFVTSTHDPIMFFTNRGRAYQLNCYEIPEAGRTARGTAMVNLLQLEGGEKVTAMLPVPQEKVAGHYLVMATRFGTIKRTELSEFTNLRRSGLIAVVLREEDELIAVRLTDGSYDLLLGTRQGMAIRFPESELRPIGRAAMGVRSIDLAEGDQVVDMSLVEEDGDMLAITENGYGKRTSVEEYRVQSRAGKGIKAMNLTEKTGLLVGQMPVLGDEDILLITDDGTVIRTPVDAIPVLGRNTQGVRVMRVQEGCKVVCIARAEAEEEEDAEMDAEEETNPEE
ncbi:MAG TPA: DNA gyrase subunit A [Candidatus Pullichristensenella excrementigallinarum]|uniref:DNA gyrase subunit A n=1 Tax=Candidatus Pullichristensenella excrementigallinarum TaxID=2840907 RepID=A0A9D1ID67_9FIRM|nr:DNA gyrase subunit A [Candidatus Pullichristensenella excrementigallinarum]